MQKVSDVWPQTSVFESRCEESRTADFSVSVEDDYTGVGHSFFHSHGTPHFA